MSAASFESRSSRFEERVRESFVAQLFMGYLGAELTRVEPGSIEIVVPFREELTQQHGFFHGGVVGTLADNAAGFAAFSLMSDDEQPLSVEFKVNLMSPAQGSYLTARAEVIRDGRRLKICRTEVFVETPQGEKHCATAIATIMALRDPIS